MEPETREFSWFSRYLTLRNFISAAVVMVAGIRVVFTWYTADKNTQLTVYKERYETSEKSRAAVEADINYWKNEADDFKSDAEKKAQELQKQQGRADQLQKDLDAERYKPNDNCVRR